MSVFQLCFFIYTLYQNHTDVAHYNFNAVRRSTDFNYFW